MNKIARIILGALALLALILLLIYLATREEKPPEPGYTVTPIIVGAVTQGPSRAPTPTPTASPSSSPTPPPASGSNIIKPSYPATYSDIPEPEETQETGGGSFAD